ncbi:MAG: Crp/Fnr family transcriptional regulator [Desulfovibrionaceae bacterium]
MNAYELFRGLPLFVDLDDDALRSLAGRARLRVFQVNDRIISRSDEAQAFFVVLSGRVKIYRSNEEGKEQILYLVEAGQPFCFCTAFTDRPYPVNVDALEESRVADIPARDMEDLARREPMLLLKIMQTLSGRLLEAMNLVESLAFRGARERIAHFLLNAEACSKVNFGEPFSLPVTHKEIAKIIGTTPETLSRVLQKFVRDNLISASGKSIRILDRKRLERCYAVLPGN